MESPFKFSGDDMLSRFDLVSKVEPNKDSKNNVQDEQIMSSGPPSPTFSFSHPGLDYDSHHEPEEQDDTSTCSRNANTTKHNLNFREQASSSLKNVVNSTCTLPRFRLISANISLFTMGMHDACFGSIMPYAQSFYGLTYMIVSLLFVSQCIGFLLASLANTFITDRLGMGKALAVGCCLQALGYTIVSPALPFPAFCFGYGMSAFGIALQDAQASSYVAGLPQSSTKLGWLHAIYGLGGFASPLIATAMIEQGVQFNLYYLVLIGFTLISFACLVASFRLKPDPRDYDVGTSNNKDNDNNSNNNTNTNSNSNNDIEMAPMTTDTETFQQPSTPPKEQEIKSSQKLKKILSNKATIVASAFLLVFVGSEVSMGGWIVSYLIDHRNGDSSAGYVSAGFYGGLTLGRVALLKVNTWVGERRAIWLYLAISFALEFVVYFAPNLIANAVAVSFVGFFLGPLYPIVISIMTKILPRSLHPGSIGFASALGQTGSALFPFITGSMAQKFDIQVLHPIMLILLGVLSIIWIFMPLVSRRTE